jgi:phospholipid/cholesterol/gamma-HCH transport system substrate-binding protein
MKLGSDRLRVELKRARNPVLWLTFLIVTTIVTSALIAQNLVLVTPFENRYVFNAAFDTVKGITPQTKVYIAGVEVGRVQEIRTEEGQGILTLSLESQYGPVYRDAKIQTRPLTLLEDMFVSIEDRGTPQAGQVNEEDPPLPAEQAITPTYISRALNTFDPQVRDRLNVLLHELGRGLPGNGRDLKLAFLEIAPFLHSAENVTEVMSIRRRRVSRIVSNFAALTGELADRDRELNKLVAGGNDTVSALAAETEPLKRTIAELPPTMGAMRDSFGSLRAAEDELDPALVELLPAARELRSGLGGLERFSDDAAPAFRALRPTMRELRPLAEELDPTSRALEGAVNELRPQAPRFDHITSLIVPCRDRVSRFFQHTPSVLKFGQGGAKRGPYPRGNITEGGTFLDITGASGDLGGGDRDLKKIRHCYTQAGG